MNNTINNNNKNIDYKNNSNSSRNNNNLNNNYKNTKNNSASKLSTPITDTDIKSLKIGNKVTISGKIYTGRDAALPKLVSILNNTNDNNPPPFDILGSAIIHTACSDAGISPTTSNKEEIESSMEYLSKSGVKIHIGKGSLSNKTVNSLNKYNSAFIITPPVAALLNNKVKSKKVAAFEEEGIEAIFELIVENIPGIVAIANGKSIY